MEIHFPNYFLDHCQDDFLLVPILFMDFRCYFFHIVTVSNNQHFFVFFFFYFIWLLWWYRFVRDKCFLLLFRYNFSFFLSLYLSLSCQIVRSYVQFDVQTFTNKFCIYFISFKNNTKWRRKKTGARKEERNYPSPDGERWNKFYIDR